MRNIRFVLVAVLFSGCAASELEVSSIDQAVAIPAFMKNARKAKIYEASPSSAPDADGTVSWDIKEVGQIGDDDGTVIWDIKEAGAIGVGELHGVDGRLRCLFSDGVLMDAGGRPLLVVREGDLYDATGRTLRYQFVGQRVLDAKGLAMTTEPELESADPLQQATVGALLDGLCR